MDNKFRNQLLTESKKKEEELKNVSLEIEERAVSKKGPFVLIRNKNNKWVSSSTNKLKKDISPKNYKLKLLFANFFF